MEVDVGSNVSRGSKKERSILTLDTLTYTENITWQFPLSKRYSNK